MEKERGKQKDTMPLIKLAIGRKNQLCDPGTSSGIFLTVLLGTGLACTVHKTKPKTRQL